jgi:hypothetical protein
MLVAVPYQNRLDVAQGIFQLKLYNNTQADFDVVAVQLVWEGITTPVSHRENMLIAGDRLDYPVPLSPARCVDGTASPPVPSLASAVAAVTLRSGEVVQAQVVDLKGFAKKLYLSDCERQFLGSQVDIEWVDLHEASVDGRPVTEGGLRVTRQAATGPVAITHVSNTITFTFDRIDPSPTEVAMLTPGQSTITVPIRFTEGRCDAHAVSESSQPFNFIVQVDVGDGIVRPLVVVPPASEQSNMRRRMERACEILGDTGFVGQADETTVPPTAP